MAKSGKGQSAGTAGPKSAAKDASKELARLEKRLQKARDVEAKRKKQAAEARAEVVQLTAQIKGLRPAPAHGRSRRPPRPVPPPLRDRERGRSRLPPSRLPRSRLPPSAAAPKPTVAVASTATKATTRGIDDVDDGGRPRHRPPRERRARGRRFEPTDRATALARPDATSPANRPGRRAALGAAVDLGSNSVHLLVAAVAGHRLEPLVDESVFLGLGDAVHDGQPLGSAGRGELVATLVRYVETARRLGVAEITLLGTEPLRRAARRGGYRARGRGGDRRAAPRPVT